MTDITLQQRNVFNYRIMDLNNLIKSVGKAIIISRVQVYTDQTSVTECVQGILKEIRENTIVIEQCFSGEGYLSGGRHTTEREFAKGGFVLLHL